MANTLPVTIGRNSIGAVTLRKHETIQGFALENAARLASLLHVLKQHHQEIDGGFMSDLLDLANDMSYQVEQALEKMSIEGMQDGLVQKASSETQILKG
jgi:hypothetical protein